MLDIGWSEFLVIGVVALVVIGPNELPGALRTAGRYIARARALASDFRVGLDDIAQENDFKDIQRRISGDEDWFDVEGNNNKIINNQSLAWDEDQANKDESDATDGKSNVDEEEYWDEIESSDASGVKDDASNEAEVDVSLTAFTNKGNGA